MISRYNYQDMTWIDLESPTAEEIGHIAEEYKLPAIVAEEMPASILRSKVESYPEFIYLVLHFPVLDEVTDRHVEQEVDFIVGKDFIITIRYEIIDPVHNFAKFFETKSMIENERQMGHGGFVFMQMMKTFYEHSIDQLEDTELTIKDIEHRIFNGQESSTVRKLSTVSRKLLDFKQAIRFHRDILQSYESASTHLFGEKYKHYAELISFEFSKVSNVLENHRDVLMELQRTNDSLLSTKSNEIMTTFTVMTFIMLPLTLITGVFGMNTLTDLIFIRTIQDFFFVLGAMIITGVVMFLFFKFRKWL